MSNQQPALNRQSYLTKNTGDYPAKLEIAGVVYEKVEDLRYGTNPHQSAAFFRPTGVPTPIGSMEILKTGKSGLSQTNLEDISYALNIVKYFDAPACAVMKHVNPSGTAVARKDDSLRTVYQKARDCDPRAAFGSVVAFNMRVDSVTAAEIMGSYVECVVAPEFDPEALKIFNDSEKHKLNKHIRIVKCGDLSTLPKFVGDETTAHRTVKVLADGSLIFAAPLLTKLRSVADIKPAQAETVSGAVHTSKITPSPSQLDDLLAAWYINLSVRSNGVVILKNGQTLSVGTGEQDRVGAVEQAVWKFKNKYEGDENIVDAVMASDGFFPFPDAVEVAAEAGVSAIIAPAGSLKDADVIKRANELNVALVYAPERVFSHH